MEQKQEKERRDWTGYGSAERPVVVTYYHVEDDHGVHQLLSMNDRAIWDLFGDQPTFEQHLAARYRSLEFVGSGMVIVKPAPTAVRLWKSGKHSAPSRTPFRSHPTTVRLPTGIGVRLQTGMLFGFTTGCCSASDRNRVRLRPDSPIK
jgi:hypothetical protein